MADNLDIAAWMNRAELFVRGLHSLQGKWGIGISVEPPVEKSDIETISSRFNYDFPPELLRIYTEGARKFKCTYSWSPDPVTLKKLAKVFPHQYTIYGGARFIPWDELWETLGIDGWIDPNDPDPKRAEEGKIWERTVPFIQVGNGDTVGIHLKEDSDERPVVYLCHDAYDSDSVTVLSESFEPFLVDWEQLAYIGPEIWLMYRFLGKKGRGPIKVRKKRASRLRRLLQGE